MTAHINHRTSTKRHQSAASNTPFETTTPSDPRSAPWIPRWLKLVGGAIAVTCLAATGILLGDTDSEPSPAESINRGPNTDLPSDWTVNTPTEPNNRGPNTDLPSDWTVNTPTEPNNRGPNTDLPSDWTVNTPTEPNNPDPADRQAPLVDLYGGVEVSMEELRALDWAGWGTWGAPPDEPRHRGPNTDLPAIWTADPTT